MILEKKFYLAFFIHISYSGIKKNRRKQIPIIEPLTTEKYAKADEILESHHETTSNDIEKNAADINNILSLSEAAVKRNMRESRKNITPCDIRWVCEMVPSLIGGMPVDIST